MHITRKSFLAKSPIDLDTANSDATKKFKHIKEALHQTIKQPQLTSKLIWIGSARTTEHSQKCIIKLTIYWSQNNHNFVYFKERIQSDNTQKH